MDSMFILLALNKIQGEPFQNWHDYLIVVDKSFFNQDPFDL